MTEERWAVVLAAFNIELKALSPSSLVLLIATQQGFEDIVGTDYDPGDPNTWTPAAVDAERKTQLLNATMVELDERFSGTGR